MPRLQDRSVVGSPREMAPARARPVMLGTLSVRVDPNAERMALESALEAGVPLLVANMLPLLPMFPATLMLVGPAGLTLPGEEDLDAVRGTARRAAERGIPTELLRVTARRPVPALLELASERDVGLLVFGPDARRMRPWRFRAAARRIRAQASCLVWVAPDG